MTHKQGTIIAIASFLLVFALVPSLSSAQSHSSSIKIVPVGSGGSSSGAAVWQDGQIPAVTVSGLPIPAGATGRLIDVYLADPVTFADRSLILEALPSSDASHTYPIDSGTLTGTSYGTYGLVLVYTFNNPQREQYIATSSVNVTLTGSSATGSFSRSSGSNNDSNGSNQSGCASGFMYDVILDYCVPATETYYSDSPTVDVGSSPASSTAAQNNVPSGSGAANLPSGLAICTGVADGSGRPICDFTYLLQEGRTFIDWLFVISVPVAVALFAYGGILYIIGTSSKRTQANGIFKNTAIGFAIMLVAWVLVYTIVGWITASGSGITTFLGT